MRVVDIDGIQPDWVRQGLQRTAVQKFNPHHDAKGRFASKDTASQFLPPPPDDPVWARVLADPDGLAAAQERAAGKDIGRPPFVLGFEAMASSEKMIDYVATKGQEWKAQPLPKGIRKGVKKQCYMNASKLMMDGQFGLAEGELTYCEGFVYTPDTGTFAILHAWVVDSQGNVIDNTLAHPEKNRYFGVKYDSKAYMRHLAQQKVYGVMGGKDQGVRDVLERGGL